MRKRVAIGLVLGMLALFTGFLAIDVLGRAASGVNGTIVSIQAPSKINAGEAVTVTVTLANAQDGATVNLMMQGTFGPRMFRSVSTGNVATFATPAGATRTSGVTTLVATIGWSTAQTVMTITPGPPVEPLEPLIGARSIVADGKSWSMVVVVPRDALGNPVSDGVPVNLRANHPDGSTLDQTLAVQHLLAWTRVTSGLVAGKTTVAVWSGAAHGPEGAIVEVAGWPVAFTVSAYPSPIPADGRAITTLKTSYMVDVNGNVITDGTLVTFIVKDQLGGERRIPAIVVGGVAQAALIAPTQATTLDVWATVYSAESTHARVEFTGGPAVGTVAVSAQVEPAKGIVAIDSGPWIGSLGQYAPDGSIVSFVISAPDGSASSHQATIVSGHATIELRLVDFTPGAYSIEASLGSASGSASIEIPSNTSATPVATP